MALATYCLKVEGVTVLTNYRHQPVSSSTLTMIDQVFTVLYMYTSTYAGLLDGIQGIKHNVISHDEILDRLVITSFGYRKLMFGLKETILWPEKVLTAL